MQADKTVKFDGEHSTFEANMYFTDNGLHILIAVYFPMGGWALYHSVGELYSAEVSCGSEGDYKAVHRVNEEWSKFNKEYN